MPTLALMIVQNITSNVCLSRCCDSLTTVTRGPRSPHKDPILFLFITSTIMTIDRDTLISEYVDRILDNMSTKDLMRIVGDQLEENLSSYTDDELISEVSDHYPELLED